MINQNEWAQYTIYVVGPRLALDFTLFSTEEVQLQLWVLWWPSFYMLGFTLSSCHSTLRTQRNFVALSWAPHRLHIAWYVQWKNQAMPHVILILWRNMEFLLILILILDVITLRHDRWIMRLHAASSFFCMCMTKFIHWTLKTKSFPHLKCIIGQE